MKTLEYWFLKKDYKPFYKFLEPCADEHYHLGDSWTEEYPSSKTIPIVKDRLDESHTPYEQILNLFHI